MICAIKCQCNNIEGSTKIDQQWKGQLKQTGHPQQGNICLQSFSIVGVSLGFKIFICQLWHAAGKAASFRTHLSQSRVELLRLRRILYKSLPTCPLYLSVHGFILRTLGMSTEDDDIICQARVNLKWKAWQ